MQLYLSYPPALQVNSGVLGVCMAFYSPDTERGMTAPKEGSRLRASELETLTNAIIRFVSVCKLALLVHGKAVGESDADFHEQLKQSLEELLVEISTYIPFIRKRTTV